MHSVPAWVRFLPSSPPPNFADPGNVIMERLGVLRPARRIDVPTWAESSRYLSTKDYQGLWRNDFAPYMTEPSRMATSRKYSAVVFAGPARTSKSESLVLNGIGHRIECAPADTLVVCQTKDSATSFSEKKLAPMLRANKDLAAKQLSVRGADNIHKKKFQGNMDLVIGWPVIGFFSQNEYTFVVLTDRDRMPDDIDGEGDPLTLAKKRTQQAGSLGMVVEESSPGRVIEQDDWTPQTLHEAPPCSGLLGDYNLGTRGAFYWHCPSCGDPFRPEFERLQWETKATPGESARTVEMVCPNGCCISQGHKYECNRAGIWLHETNDGKSVCEIDDRNIRDTDVVSYRCEGPIAAMQSWEQLVSRYLQAKETFETTGDDNALKATITLDQGRPYLPVVRSIGDSLSEDTLKALAERYPLKVASPQTRFITVQVDIQINRFVVQVDSWGEGLERWMIDRFDIAQPPATAPGAERDEKGNARRAIDPARYFEDWDALRDLLHRAYPVAGTEFALMPVAMIIDSGGRPGVTPNAYRFLRWANKHGLGQRVYLAKGSSRLNDRARHMEPEKVLQQKGRKVSDIKLVFINTDKLKDEIVVGLTRKEAGPGKFHLSELLPAQVFSELASEVRTDSGWERRKSGSPNEAFDLSVYGKALVIILKGESIDWSNGPRLPHWARPANENSFAVRQKGSEEPDQLIHPPPVRRRRVLSQGIR
ncbi:terminase gpA endonuclease subunit [Shinella zoogloeoides]|uniref:terminase gpA endonuclease subunit n=1 Tax=Shinella zoogloeoides TaxID=352475 RepID=UPI00273FB524|nr:terminase gpA endonuclease subunit [Shinella zoogloeoides]WLR92170.1 phage terminase large subunit family protein [Shinella zoogloeoides]